MLKSASFRNFKRSAQSWSWSKCAPTNSFNTRVVVYEKNPDVVQLMIAQPFVQLAPQPVGLTFEIPCFARVGGAMAVRPMGLVFLDGV